MHKAVPYVVFAVVYGGVGLMLGALGDELLASESLEQLVALAAAPIALLAGWRFGRLSWPGVLLASALIALAAYAAIVAILHGIAVPAGGSVGLLAPARAGGWPFAIGNGLVVLSPLAWLYLIGRLRQSGRSGAAA